MLSSWHALALLGALALVGCVDDIVFGSGGGGGGDSTSTSGTTTAGTTVTGGTTTAASTTGTGGASGTTGAGGAECGPGSECVPAAGAGWQGPALLVEAPSCPVGSTKLHALGTSASSSGVCPCQPGATPPCAPPQSTLYGGAACGAGGDALILDATNCTDVSVGANDGAQGGPIPAVNPLASCILSGAGAPPPAFADEASLCDSAAGACSDGDCLGGVAAGERCVFRTDPSDCSTAGPYSVDRSLVTATVSCTCSGITASCGGQTLLFSENGCQAADLEAMLNHPSPCVSSGGTTQSARFQPTDVSLYAGVCATPSSTVATSPMQVCCLP